MRTPQERIAWCERNLRTKEGRPYRAIGVEGREWVLEELFRPTGGWRLWARDPSRLCDQCKSRAGEWVEFSWELLDETEEHADDNPDCGGLELTPVMVVALNLPRREGKTLNTAALCIETVFNSPNKYITYMASAGKQSRTLFDENVKIPINTNAKLARRCELRGEVVRVPKTRSKLEVIESSHRSATGRGRTHLVIDEARDVSARLASAFLPSMRDQNGMDCTADPKHLRGAAASLKGPRVCSVCGAATVPWFGIVVLESSSGIIEDNDSDWFQEFVDKYTSKPHRNVHVLRMEESQNPDVASEATDMIKEVFGTLSAMSTYIDVEMSNTARRPGDDFVSEIELDRVMSRKLLDQLHAGSLDPAIGFLDTSTTKDLTTLVIMTSDRRRSKETWGHINLSRLEIWDPAKQPKGIIDSAIVYAALKEIVPAFPRLSWLAIDTRNMPWARELVATCRRDQKKWGRHVCGYNGGREDRDDGWLLFEDRIKRGTITLPDHPIIRREIKGVRRYIRANGSVEIRDRSRKKQHADVIEAIATCCLKAYQLATKPQRSLGAVNAVSRMSRDESAGGYTSRMGSDI